MLLLLGIESSVLDKRIGVLTLGELRVLRPRATVVAPVVVVVGVTALTHGRTVSKKRIVLSYIRVGRRLTAIALTARSSFSHGFVCSSLLTNC